VRARACVQCWSRGGPQAAAGRAPALFHPISSLCSRGVPPRVSFLHAPSPLTPARFGSVRPRR
jgi:hypothetical protein